MKIAWLLGVLMILASASAAAMYAPDIVLVHMKDAKTLDSASYGLTSVAQEALPDVNVYTVPEGSDPLEMAKELSKRDDVLWAEPDYLYETTSYPNDPLFSQQWALKNTQYSGADIHALDAWNESKGEGTIIAVIDSGVNYVHEDLKNQFWVNPEEDANDNGVPDFYSSSQGGDLDGIDIDQNCHNIPYASTLGPSECIDDLIGYDFVREMIINCVDEDCDGPEWNISDTSGHGTNVAGIVTAETDNLKGISGTCPECKLMVLRACYVVSVPNGFQTTCSTLSAAQGIHYATDMGARVISMSMGGTAQSSIFREATEYAAGHDVVLIASAGNYNTQTVQYPAGYDDVIAVAATTNNDQKASFSSYGTWVDISAPGTYIATTSRNSAYRVDFGGTSASAPLVAGVAGLIIGAKPSATAQEVEDALMHGADSINAINPNYIGLLGAGRANAYKSICWLTNCAPPTIKITNPAASSISISEGSVIIASAQASDPEGKTTTIQWYLLSGSSKTFVGTGSSHTFRLPTGTYTIEAQANDGELTSSATFQANVYSRSGTPRDKITAEQSSAY
jgi:subtilisin family serine protease